MMIKRLPFIIGFVLAFFIEYLMHERDELKQQIKDRDTEIELIGNFCADSIPPRILENGRGK